MPERPARPGEFVVHIDDLRAVFRECLGVTGRYVPPEKRLDWLQELNETLETDRAVTVTGTVRRIEDLNRRVVELLRELDRERHPIRSRVRRLRRWLRIP